MAVARSRPPIAVGGAFVPLDDGRRSGRAGSPAGGRSPRCSNGDRSNSTGSGHHVSESSGSRRPIGESPGVRYSRPRRSFQVVVPQPVPSGVVCSGMTNPTGSAMRAAADVDQTRPGVRVGDVVVVVTSSVGGSPAGRRASRHAGRPGPRSAAANATRDRGRTAAAMPSASERARRSARRARRSHGSASRSSAPPQRLAVVAPHDAESASGAAARPDTTCPARAGSARRSRTGLAQAQREVQRAARASPRRRRPCSTRRPPCRRSTRTSARRPS